MKFGFIGAGSMGSLLVEALVASGAIRPENIVVSSRTPSRVESLASKVPGIVAASSNKQTAAGADCLFLCVKPLDFHEVLEEIAPALAPGNIVVSITSPVKLATLEERLPCKTAKIIPSIVNAVGGGASLFMWGTRLTAEDREMLWALFSRISKPIEIAESAVRAASDLSSCGPAFLAYLLEEFIEAAVLSAGMNRDTATSLACEMMLGTARLLLEEPCDPRQLQARVTVPGGITAAALEVLRGSTRGLFDEVLRTTHAKFEEDLERVERSLLPRGAT